MKNDTLGDRLKFYEGMTEIMLMPTLPVIARIDGRSFHTFTKGMDRPYDSMMSACMIATAKKLAIATNAVVAYTQSDEITLIWNSTSFDSQIFFNGRHSKMVSNLASLATLYFYQEVLFRMPSYASRNPSFDCRVFNVPSLVEAVNILVWREQDATKNAISMAARAYFSDKECLGKNGSEKQEMLFQKFGINFNDYPAFFKRGTYIRRKTKAIPFTTEEIEKLPAKHEARKNPDFKIMRSSYEEESGFPQLSKIKNRVLVIFSGADPETE